MQKGIDYTNLIKIDPQSINSEEGNIFFGLSLIRNDIYDLVYLQGLHSENEKNFDLSKTVSADVGSYVGKNIFILRLAFSMFYNILEFFEKNRKLIEEFVELQNIIKTLDSDAQKLWSLLLKISNKKDSFLKKDLDMPGINKAAAKILIIAASSRHELTFHYWNSSRWLARGFKKGFQNRLKENTKYAFATEKENVDIDRTYYVDLSIMEYLKDKANLTDDLFSIEGDFINLLSGLNKIISNILKIYHSKLEIRI